MSLESLENFISAKCNSDQFRLRLFVDIVYLMASAFDPIFAYHWIDIDVDAEHNEAQISHTEQNTKCKIEELIVKKRSIG